MKILETTKNDEYICKLGDLLLSNDDALFVLNTAVTNSVKKQTKAFLDKR